MNQLVYKSNKLLNRQVQPKNISQSWQDCQVWYGRAGDWGDMSIVEKDISYCIEYGVSGYAIELSKLVSDSFPAWDDNWVKEITAKYKKLVKMIRAAGMWLFVTITSENFNNKFPNFETTMRCAAELVNVVHKNGNSNIVVQPISKSTSNAAKLFENFCAFELSNFNLVYDGYSVDIPEGIKYRVIHPSSITELNSIGSFVVCDDPKLLEEFNDEEFCRVHAKNTYCKNHVAPGISSMFFNCINTDCPVVCFYGPIGKMPNKKLIQIIGSLVSLS